MPDTPRSQFGRIRPVPKAFVRRRLTGRGSRAGLAGTGLLRGDGQPEARLLGERLSGVLRSPIILSPDDVSRFVDDFYQATGKRPAAVGVGEAVFLGELGGAE